jgi:hypothetical protein
MSKFLFPQLVSLSSTVVLLLSGPAVVLRSGSAETLFSGIVVSLSSVIVVLLSGPVVVLRSGPAVVLRSGPAELLRSGPARFSFPDLRWNPVPLFCALLVNRHTSKRKWYRARRTGINIRYVSNSWFCSYVVWTHCSLLQWPNG